MHARRKFHPRHALFHLFNFSETMLNTQPVVNDATVYMRNYRQIEAGGVIINKLKILESNKNVVYANDDKS